MKRQPARLLLALLLFLIAALPAAEPPAFFSEIGAIEAGLANITGLSFTRTVPYGVLNKDQLRAFLDERIKKALKPADVRAEELTLKMLGLIPPDFDLRQNTVDLLTEQAAAFYDYNKKKLFILQGASGGIEERTALVHELAHALADQHFHLAKYIREGARSDDGSTARLAVMEGQATWLTWAYVSKRNGGKAEVSKETIEKLTDNSSTDGADFPVFAKEPLYLRESLVFPYDEGMKFQDAVYHKLGRKSFDEIFNRPPRSTRQILHPADYLEDEKPVDVDPPSLDKKQFHVINDGSVGEFDHSMLLRQFVPEKEGRAAASHWRGGAFRLYEHKKEKYPVLAYASEWSTPAAAREVFTLYQRVMKGKWKTMKVTERASDHVFGTGDSGKFELRISGTRVTSIEGLR